MNKKVQKGTKLLHFNEALLWFPNFWFTIQYILFILSSFYRIFAIFYQALSPGPFSINTVLTSTFYFSGFSILRKGFGSLLPKMALFSFQLMKAEVTADQFELMLSYFPYFQIVLLLLLSREGLFLDAGFGSSFGLAHCPIKVKFIINSMEFILAYSRYKRGRFEQAIETCDQLLQKNSKDEAAWVLKCQCLVRDNYVDELETEEDGLADALLQDNQKNNLARAGTSFKNSTSHNPVLRPMSNGRVNTGFQRVGTSIASRSGSKAGNMLRTGRIMTKNGVPATSNGRVLRLATASLQQYGQNFFDVSKADLKRIAQRKSKARVVFQYLFYVEHNLRKALQLAVYATQLNKFQDPWWKLSLAKCYYHLSFISQAEKQLLSSVKHNNNVQSYLYLSRIYQKQDNVEKSIGILNTALEMHPNEPKLYIAIGRIYDDLGKFQDSYAQYQNALTLENCNIEAVANIASYYYYKDQGQISLKLYQRLIQLGYDSAQVWNNLALCCFSIGQYDVFYNCFERALSLAEDDIEIMSDIWYNIGNIYINLGDLEMAKQAYKSALALLPENMEVLNNMAVISWREGNLDLAINYAQKSYRSSSNFEACYNLSLWYYESLQFQKSYYFNKETLKIYPEHTESRTLANRLQHKLEFL